MHSLISLDLVYTSKCLRRKIRISFRKKLNLNSSSKSFDHLGEIHITFGNMLMDANDPDGMEAP